MSIEYNIQYYASLNDITNQPIFEYNTTEPNNLIVGNINDTNGVIGGYTWKIYSIDDTLVSNNTVYRNGTDISSLGNSFKLYKYDIKVYYYSNRSFAESKQTALGSYSISNENPTFTLTNKTIDGAIVSQWVIARSSSGTTPPGISTDNIVNADGDYYIFTKPIASLHLYDTESHATAKEITGLYGIQDYYSNNGFVYVADGTQYIHISFNIDPSRFNYLTSPDSLDNITSNSWVVTSPGPYDPNQYDFNYYSEYFITSKNLKINGEWFFYEAPIYEIKYYLYLESEDTLDIYNNYNNYKVGSANNNLKGITRWLTNYNDNPLIYYNNGETLTRSDYTFYAAPNYIINFYENYEGFLEGGIFVYCGSNATINLSVIYCNVLTIELSEIKSSDITWVIDSTDHTNFNPTKWNRVQEKTLINYTQSIDFAPTSGTLYNIYPLTYYHSYYRNYTDATEGTNAIRSFYSIQPFKLMSIAGHTTKTKWRDIGNANSEYNTGDLLSFTKDYKFYPIYTVIYYENLNDAENNQNIINTYKTSNDNNDNNDLIFGNSINGNFNWIIYKLDDTLQNDPYTIYNNGTALPNAIYTFYLYKAPYTVSYTINYYNTLEDITNDIINNIIYTYTTTDINSLISGISEGNSIGQYNWIIYKIDDNETNSTTVYNYNTNLPHTGLIYYLYKAPEEPLTTTYTIQYYLNLNDAIANTEMVNEEILDSNNFVLSSYTYNGITYDKWILSSDNTGSSSKTIIYSTGDSLTFDSNYKVYAFTSSIVNYYSSSDINDNSKYLTTIEINNSYLVNFNYVNENTIIYPRWKIHNSSINTTGTYNTIIIYNNNEVINLAQGIYNVYAVPYSILYYDFNNQPLGDYSTFDSSTFKVGQSSPGNTDIGGKTVWILVNNLLAPISNYVIENDTVLDYDSNKYLKFYDKNYINYYNNQIDAENKTNPIGTFIKLSGTISSSDFIVGNTITGDISLYSNWKISSSSTGTSQRNIVYNNNDSLNITGNYHLYPAPMYKIIYYDTNLENELGINESYDGFTIGTITNSSSGGNLLGYTKWIEVGDQNNTVYSNNDILTFDRNYYLYAAPMYTITYYSDESKTTELGINESYDGFTIGNITNSSSGGNLLGYTKWKIIGQSNTVYSNNDTISFDRDYELYAAPMYTITYYSDEFKTTELGINESYDGFTIGTITNSGNLLGYTKWQEIGQNIAYFNNDILIFGKDYELYPVPILIKYYESKTDADSSINVIYTKNIYEEEMAVGDGLTGDISVITSWKIATNSSGTDLTIDDNYLSNGTILTKDGDYNLYPAKSYSIKYYDTYDDLIADLNDNLNPTGRMLKEDTIYTPYNFKPSNYNDINEWIIAHINENNGSSDKKTVYDNTKLLTFDDDYYVYAFKFSKITYYSDINLTTLLGSYSYSSKENFNLGDNVSLNYSIWQISETSASTSPYSTGVIYYNGDDFASGVYNVYIGSYNLSYYDDTEKKIAQYSTTESADFIIGNVSSDSDNISEYTKWLIYDNIIDKTLLYNYIHYNDDLLDFNKNYTLIAFNKNYINYYSNKSDADNKTNPIATLLSNINFVVGSVSYDDYTLTASKWLVSTSSTGTTNGIVNNNDLLNYDGDYHLYIAEFNIYYYGSLDDALNNTELLNTTTTTDPTDFKISTIGSFNSWRIADNINGNGTSDKGTVYTLNNLLNFDGNYYLYPNVVCFLEGTRILCKINNEEKYINIEYIRPGTLVKTYLHGYKKIYKIGYNKLNNNNIYNEDRPKNMLYKLTKDKYNDLLDDLYITGCHSILTDEITENQINKTINDNKNVYSTDGKYRLMAYIDDKAELYRKSGVFNIWHFALEHDDYYMNYGVYANGLLVETTSKRFMDKLSNLNII